MDRGPVHPSGFHELYVGRKVQKWQICGPDPQIPFDIEHVGRQQRRARGAGDIAQFGPVGINGAGRGGAEQIFDRGRMSN
jgi:hypothetical protein